MTAVDIIIGIVKRLTEAEIEEFIVPKIQELAGKIFENNNCHIMSMESEFHFL